MPPSLLKCRPACTALTLRSLGDSPWQQFSNSFTRGEAATGRSGRVEPVQKGFLGRIQRLRQDSRIMAASLGAEASAKARGWYRGIGAWRGWSLNRDFRTLLAPA